MLPTAGSLETGKDDVPFGACVVFAGFTGNCEVVAEPCEVTLLAVGWRILDAFVSVLVPSFVVS